MTQDGGFNDLHPRERFKLLVAEALAHIIGSRDESGDGRPYPTPREALPTLRLAFEDVKAMRKVSGGCAAAGAAGLDELDTLLAAAQLCATMAARNEFAISAFVADLIICRANLRG